MSLITRTPVLWTLFVLSIAAFLAFIPFIPAIGGTLLDSLSDPAALREALAGMTPKQKSTHFWMTVLLDVAFPVLSGLFFAGIAWRFFGKAGPVAAMPGFAFTIVDLTENTLQALALSGAADALDAKAWVTPLKMYLFYAAAVIALVALGIAVFRRVTKPKA